MKFSKLIFGLFILLTTYACKNKQQPNDDKFHGMWKLDKFETFDSVSAKWSDDTTRIGYSGFILYDGKGHMGVHLTPKGYKDFDTNKNIDSLDIKDLKELVKFYQSNFVYFADYETTDSTIAHKRLSATNPKDWGSVLTRDFEFKNDTLILIAHESMRGKKIRLRWIKL